MTATLLAVFRGALALLLLLAGVTKALDRARFESALFAFDIVSARPARFLSTAIPATEITLGALIGAGLFARQAAVATAILISLFSIALSSVIASGREVECGCFGQLSRGRVTRLTLLRNALMAAAAAVIALFGPGALAVG